MTLRIVTVILAIGLVFPLGVSAETISTLTLDWASYVSFGEVEDVGLPAGSTIQFRFGDPNPDGSVPFTIDPTDVSIAPAPLPQSAGTLQYSLPTSTTGLMSTTATGRRIDFNATVRATISGAAANGSFDYNLPFTTEIASATNLPQTVQLTVAGLRMVEGVWWLQLVGATTNKANAYPQPGTAVYTVLSGSFDQVP